MPKAKSIKRVVSNITLENAKIGFRNFAGKESEYNPKGNRNFAVFLEKEFAEELERDGWNIKWPKSRTDPDEELSPFLPVKVSFGNYPPKIVVITSYNQVMVDEETVDRLDWAEISNVDLIIRPYTWDVNGKTGIKAYAKTMYVTLVEDPFEAKYRNVPTGLTDEEELPPWEE